MTRKKRRIPAGIGFILFILTAFSVYGGAALAEGEGAASVAYHTHVQTYGWQDWKTDGDSSGTTGESKRLEAIEIRLDSAYSGGVE